MAKFRTNKNIARNLLRTPEVRALVDETTQYVEVAAAQDMAKAAARAAAEGAKKPAPVPPAA